MHTHTHTHTIYIYIYTHTQCAWQSIRVTRFPALQCTAQHSHPWSPIPHFYMMSLIFTGHLVLMCQKSEHMNVNSSSRSKRTNLNKLPGDIMALHILIYSTICSLYLLWPNCCAVESTRGQSRCCLTCPTLTHTNLLLFPHLVSLHLVTLPPKQRDGVLSVNRSSKSADSYSSL